MAFGFFKKKAKESVESTSSHSGPHYYNLVVKEIINETKDAISIVMEHPKDRKIVYKSGQFLTLILSVNGKEVRRAYSLCSSPFVDDDLVVTVKRVDAGLMSNWLPDNLKVGDTLKIMEPMGHFTLEYNEQNNRHVVLFAGGSGITPMMSLIKSTLLKEPQSKVTLVYFNRDIDSIIFRDELDLWKSKYNDRFNIIHVLDTALPDWTGLSGLLSLSVFTSIKEQLSDFGNDNMVFFICGPEGMMNVAEALLTDSQIAKEKIHKESFTAPTTSKSGNSSSESKSSDEMKDREVTIRYDGEEFKIMVPAGKPILETALDAGIDLPFSCQSGLCTACRGKALSGKVKLDEEEGLSASERAEGYVLTCVGHPLTDDVVIEIG